VQSALLYINETRTIKEDHKLKLRVFEMAVLRRICGITRHDRIRNTDVKKDLGIKIDITEVLYQRRLRYFGHKSRMGPDRYPYVLLHGKVHGTRSVGRPRKKRLDNIRDDDCVDMGTTIIEATQWTANRSQWRCIINTMGRQRASTSSSSQRP